MDREERIAELVALIQQGRNDLLCDLWEELRGLVAWHAARYYFALVSVNGAAPVEVDDLVQTGFIAMVEALGVYDPARGPFKALFKFYIKKAFRTAIGRFREPLNNYVSLDEPLTEDSEETRLDFIPDSRDYFGMIDETIFQEQLHKALEAALNAIPPKEAYALRAEYWRGLKQAETAMEMNCSSQYIARLRNDGLRHIRTGPAKAQLERFLDSETPFFKSVSAERFNRTHTSAVEELVLWRDRRRREIGKSLCTT